MSDIFENKGALATTIVVAASNSLNKGQANYVCDGVQDNVEIQAALTAGAGGKVLLLEGTYNCTANLLVPASTTLEGQGFGTILDFTGAAITNAITINGNNIHIRNLKAQLAAGAGTPGSRPNVIYATGKTLLWLENLWITGDNSVADDGNDQRQDGVCFSSCTESKIVNCSSQNNRRHGIMLWSSSFITVRGNTIKTNSVLGLYLYSSSRCNVLGNHLTSNNGIGIEVQLSTYNSIVGNVCSSSVIESGITIYNNSPGNVVAGNSCCLNNKNGISIQQANYNTVTGNTCLGNLDSGIFLSLALNNIISGNNCQGNSDYGITVENSSHNNTITGNNCQGNLNNAGIRLSASSSNTVKGNICQGNTNYGIYLLTTSNYNTIEGNTCRENASHGIYLSSSHNNALIGNRCFENSQTTTNTRDDIFLDASDYNNIQGNTCQAGALANKPQYGINISNATCDKNLVANNDLYDDGFGTASFNDAGTLTHVEDNNRGIKINQIKIFRYMKNTSGAQRVAGDVVSLKAVAAGNEVTAPAAIGERQVYGMVAETINDAAWGLVQVKGKTTALKGTNAGGGDIIIGDNLITENGVRARKAAATTDPIFAQALEALAAADGVIDAYILSPWD